MTFSGSGRLSAAGGSTVGGGGGGGHVRIVATTLTEGCVNVDGGRGEASGSQGVYTTVGTVVPPPAVSLAFSQQPTKTVSGVTINPAVTVQVLNGCGNLVTSSNASVTLTLGSNPGGATLGGTLTVNAVNGIATFSNLTLNRAGTGYTLVASSNGLISATSSAFDITCQPITVSPATGALTAGTVGSSYMQQFSQSGISGAVTWSVNPPIPGLSIDATGKLSGVPTQPGDYSFTVTATDGNNCPGSTSYTLNLACPTITLPSTTLPQGTYGSTYSAQVLPSSGTAPYMFTVTGLPSGMMRTPSAGNSGASLTLGGTPTQSEDFIVQVTATDAYGCASGQQSYALKINQAMLSIIVNNAWRNQGAANPPFSGTIAGLKNGDNITATYSTTATTSSPGGTYPINATLVDPNNRLSNYQVTNNPGTLTVLANCSASINPPTLPPAALAQTYAAGLVVVALNSTVAGPYSFTHVAGQLPPGLSLVNTAGTFSLQGVPTTPGTYTFTLLAQRNVGGCSRAITYTLTIAPTVVPIAECIINNGNGTFTARFGYHNTTGAVVTIPVGVNNMFSVGAQNRNQPTVFQVGRVSNAFTVTFQSNGSDASSWLLKGPDNVLRGVILNATSPSCP